MLGRAGEMFKRRTQRSKAPAQSNPAAAAQLPVLVHPAPIPLSELPKSAKLSDQPVESPDIRQFVQCALDEALDIINTRVPPANIEPKKYHSKGSTAKVKLTHQIITAQANHLKPGWQGPVDHAWYTRCSQHDDCAAKGTANYREFVSFLKKDYATNLSYRNPSSRKAPGEPPVEWDCREFIFPGGWRNVTARINTLTETHVFGPARTYFVLEITAGRCMDIPSRTLDENAVNTEIPDNDAILAAPQAVSPEQKPLVADIEVDSDTETLRECFMIIQLPVQHEPFLAGVTCPKWNVFGSYVSVRYVVQLEPPPKVGEEQPKPQLEWKLAISASPGQLMHVFLMKDWRIGLPRMLIADVGKFFKFVEKRRHNGHRARPASVPRSPA